MINQLELKELLNYDPNTGVFTWRVSQGRAVKGKIAGGKDKGYIKIKINKTLYLAQRLAFLYMDGNFPEDCTDHINHNRSDNRFINLRKCSKKDNNKNVSKRIDNTSGITGVCWHKQHEKWYSQIQNSGKHEYIGLFSEIWDAICARKSAEIKHDFHFNHGAERSLCQ